MSAPVTDPIEELLAAALADARTDERWGVAPKAQALTSVRRAARRQRARNAGLALAAVAGATAGLSLLGDGPARQAIIQQPADGGAPATPAPGISPEWTPHSGSDWVLDKEHYDAFVAAHSVPSDRPHTVASPAILTEYSARLRDDVAGVLRDDAELVRQDAPDGDGAAAAIHVRLADGTPAEVERQPLQQPISTSYFDTAQRAVTRRDLPTGSVLVTIAHTGYGWGTEIPEGANAAYTVTPSGEQTTWLAPLSVPLATVAGWAEAADRG